MAFELSAARAYPAGVARAFDTVLPLPLPFLFQHRYAAIPPVRQVRGQGSTWSAVGQTRTVLLADGGTMLETLTEVDRPRTFAYRLTDITGPMRPLVASIDGRWSFEPAGTGVRITWAWVVHPRGRAGNAARPVFARMWGGYARTALERLEGVLVG